MRRYHKETQKKGRICRGEGKKREHGGNIMRRHNKKVVFVVERVRRGSMEEIA